MPSCSLCSGRYFKDDNGFQMHWDAKHAYSCEECSRTFNSQQALDQHDRDKHSFFECRHCDREFATEPGRDAHEKAKHAPAFECEYCDREFNSDQARLAHQRDKHPSFECEYCDREFNSDQARLAHQRDKHPTFECEYCDREFNSDQARLAHQRDKHPTFECEYCDCEFNSDQARLAHQEGKHPPMFQCRYCDCALSAEYTRISHEEAKHSVFLCRCGCTSIFSSREARQQHEDSNHKFKCNVCGTKFSDGANLRQHERITFRCGFCPAKPFTTGEKKAHEVSCGSNPAHRVVSPPRLLSDLSGSSTGDPKSKEITEEPSPSDEGSESPASRSSSSQDGELFHSTSALPSTDEDATVLQPGDGSQLVEPGTRSIAESVVSADENHQDVSHVIFQCTPCLKVFETEAAFRDHACVSLTTMLRPHCRVCYTQFDDEPSLQKHMEGLQTFSCQFCLTRCCSDEMLQDHLLLSHPTCSKCGKSFADNLALCAHVESDHPVVVCWDCGGMVVETSSLESHYTESSTHPSCGVCGVGSRNSTDMDEHVRHVHPASAATGGGDAHANPDEGSCIPKTEPLEADREGAAGHPLAELDQAPLSSSVDSGVPLGGPSDEPLPSSSPTSRASSPEPSIPPPVEHVDEAAMHTQGEAASPSPTPSEHGSNASRACKATITADARPPSPASSVSGGSFSDLSSSPASSASSNSVVFVSAEGIPEYIRENRAVLVATSAGSPSVSTPLRLSSELSLDMESLMAAGARLHPPRASPPRGTGEVPGYRLHCRICRRDPCEDMTATMCGHVFCKRCITQAIVAKSECPVCKSVMLLYCLFKLDLSV